MLQNVVSALSWPQQRRTNEAFSISYGVISSPILRTSLRLLGRPYLGQDNPNPSPGSSQILLSIFTLLSSPTSTRQVMSQVSMECVANVFAASHFGDKGQIEVTPF